MTDTVEPTEDQISRAHVIYRDTQIPVGGDVLGAERRMIRRMLEAAHPSPVVGDEREHYSKTGDPIGEKLARLLKNEASLVTIYSPNPDFTGPNHAIEFVDFIDDIPPTRFEGDTLYNCLSAALQQTDKGG